MIAILSSAKTMDFESPWRSADATQPEFRKQAATLMAELKKRPKAQIGKLMGISPKLAELNAGRFQRFAAAHTAQNAKPALLAYQGDVFEAMGSAGYSGQDLAFAQKRLRIISGLYGVLRPLDLIQPYRLEMAIKLSGESWKDLYGFWGERVTEALERDCRSDGGVIINLASQEYSGVLNPKKLGDRTLSIAFKQDRKGKIEMVPILAKRARGLMAGYIVKQRLEKPEQLKEFSTEGYRFTASLSSDNAWVFVRRG